MTEKEGRGKGYAGQRGRRVDLACAADTWRKSELTLAAGKKGGDGLGTRPIEGSEGERGRSRRTGHRTSRWAS
jgi:hypothetical protein